MNNYKLTIQYDGGRYKGWQRLGNSGQTIQGKIEEVLSRLEGKKVEITGSSRTDAGVHALAQVANVMLNKSLTEKELKQYVNRYLPEDISITNVEIADERFHSRYHTKSKTYVYKIWNADHPHPFMRNYSLHIKQRLSIRSMKRAGESFIGEHDFTAFTNAKSKKKSMIRHIYSVEIEEKDQLITIRIHGDGFLYNQVRKMVGLLIEVGLGQKEAEVIPAIIESKDRSHIDYMAGAHGLYLEDIEFN